MYVDGDVVLGHRRLSILDLSPAGHQPMESADGRLAIAFNGEIYIFLELREKLQRSNEPPQTLAELRYPIACAAAAIP